MAVRSVVVAAAIAACAASATARAQTITTEAAVTGGYSTENVSAVATQLRVFGEVKPSIRFFVEGAWAASSDTDTDAFGAAYPYHNRLQLIEAYGERLFRPAGGIIGIRAGRYRLPFGIYNGSDHAYTRFLRAPLLRYDGYFALSNNFLEHGADLIVGSPRFTVETSVGVPADVGTAVRRSGLDTSIRAQGYVGALIVGASFVRTSPYQPPLFAHGRAEFGGVDARWMLAGVEVRGEWIGGRPFDHTDTYGWYVDTLLHRAFMGPVTAVARIE